jgi:murein DD-endopeptidase MepM/ murein hydrolase activator NlpD
VIFARNDVPDGRVPAEYLQMKDPIYAIGGNIILIDHGAGEHSLLAHNQMGSVRVRTGDRVVRGQPIALMGASGSPGFPHLHYQLQSGPGLFAGDGLPAVFDNVYLPGAAARVPVPQAGVYYRAR